MAALSPLSSVKNKPGTTSGAIKKVSFTCPICDETIKDAVGRRKGQDAIECDGICATWLHRGCAGLSKLAYASLSKSSAPFYCPQCRLNKQDLEIKSLSVQVVDLASKLTEACREIETVFETK